MRPCRSSDCRIWKTRSFSTSFISMSSFITTKSPCNATARITLRGFIELRGSAARRVSAQRGRVLDPAPLQPSRRTCGGRDVVERYPAAVLVGHAPPVVGVVRSFQLPSKYSFEVDAVLLVLRQEPLEAVQLPRDPLVERRGADVEEERPAAAPAAWAVARSGPSVAPPLEGVLASHEEVVRREHILLSPVPLSAGLVLVAAGGVAGVSKDCRERLDVRCGNLAAPVAAVEDLCEGGEDAAGVTALVRAELLGGVRVEDLNPSLKGARVGDHRVAQGPRDLAATPPRLLQPEVPGELGPRELPRPDVAHPPFLQGARLVGGRKGALDRVQLRV
mmetsp:Transcript_48529/g.155232  ORF Transcript_48529/g.155232 Transcript_48529/m.155232 type:complete len:333 (+) Transcript_48529:369-1367(+)